MKGLFRYAGFAAVYGLVLVGCQRPGARGFTVKGTVDNGEVQKVYLVSDPYDNSKPPVIYDSSKVIQGRFELRGPYSANQTSYRVVFPDPRTGQDFFVVNDAPTVSLNVDGSQRGKYTVSGSPASERYRVLLDRLQHLTNGPRDTASADKTFYSLLDSTVRVESSPAVAAFALSVYLIGADSVQAAPLGLRSAAYQDSRLAALAQGLQAKFPDNTDVLEITGVCEHLVSTPRIGKELADLSLPDTSGKPFSINSLRGKYVLLDFWASWCAPCRGENPNVVKAYQQFHDRNFTVVGVSLDQDKDAWLRAIHQDHLAWTQVSDLKQWDSKAVALYQFNAIPYNILLDPDGRVIATELKGPDLEEKLAEVLK